MGPDFGHFGHMGRGGMRGFWSQPPAQTPSTPAPGTSS
jgi:hypothetical protein